VLVVSNDARVEPVLEEMAAPVVALVEALRVAEVQQVHAAREFLELAGHDEVEVVGHLA
jgi:ethanolamine utilization protein EutP (predicted NTPase)